MSDAGLSGVSIGTIVVLVGALFLYLVPAIIAASRAHHQAAAIVVLNIVLGWTALGWIGALVWSLTAVQRTTGVAVRCDNCDTPAASGAAFCPNCGTAL
jgi:hypothetical protein